jgi:hypothetical protein
MPRDIRSFFECYRDAFNRLDGHAVAQLYAEPSGIAQDGLYTRWADRASVAQNMVELCQLYRDKGFVRADFEPGPFIEQGTHHAVADVQWRINWDEAQEPWVFQTTYNLQRTERGWKVLLCTAYSESALLKAANAASHLHEK